MNSVFGSAAMIDAESWTSLPLEFWCPGLSEHSLNQKCGKELDSFLEDAISVSGLNGPI